MNDYLTSDVVSLREQNLFVLGNSFIEFALTERALSKRINDKFCAANKSKAANTEGIYVNYVLPDDDNYAALAIDNRKMKIGAKESNGKLTKQIKSDLKKLGLESSKHFVIEGID